jgi:hypothetical protein
MTSTVNRIAGSNWELVASGGTVHTTTNVATRWALTMSASTAPTIDGHPFDPDGSDAFSHSITLVTGENYWQKTTSGTVLAVTATKPV